MRYLGLCVMCMLFVACMKQNDLVPAENDSSSQGTNSENVGDTDVDSDSESNASTNIGAGTTESDSNAETGTSNGCAAGCFIDNVCFANTEKAEPNGCLICDISISTTDWSNLSDVACDDGVYCNGTDMCTAGECVGTGSPCADNAFCIEENLQCCVQDYRRFCDDAGDYYSEDSCGVEQTLLVDCPVHSTCSESGCTCEEGWFGDNCENCRVHVNGSLLHYDGHNGNTWLTAFQTVQEGIDAAAQNNCDVWVAQGMYHPADPYSTEADLYSTSFTMSQGTRLFGGFHGDEESFEQRDIETFATILSGEYYLSSSRSFRNIVRGNIDTVLDGFTISNGEAIVDGEDFGAGLLIENGSMEIKNCIFDRNSAWSKGGGIYALQSDLLIHNTQFTKNDCAGGAMCLGGAIYLNNSNATIVGASFDSNTAGSGPGVAMTNSTISVINSVFSSNTSSHIGGAAYASMSERVSFTNVLFHGNNSEANGVVLSSTNSNSILLNCTIAENGEDSSSNVILFNPSGTLRIENSILWNRPENPPFYEQSDGLTLANVTVGESLFLDNILIKNFDPFFVDPSNADFQLACPFSETDCSPCVSAGSNELLPTDEFDLDTDGDTEEQLPVDLLGNPRISGDTVDMGAYEFLP